MKGYRDDFNMDNDALVDLIVSLESHLWDTPAEVKKSMGRLKLHRRTQLTCTFCTACRFINDHIGFAEYSSRVYIGTSVSIALSILVLGANRDCSSLHVSRDSHVDSLCRRVCKSTSEQIENGLLLRIIHVGVVAEI